MVTRPRAQAADFIVRLETHGATVVPFPTIRMDLPDDFAPLDAAVRAAGTYGWVIFTSANGVEAVRTRFAALGLGPAVFGGAKVCAVGPATARALAQLGVHPTLQPDEDYRAEGLLEALKRSGGDLRGARVLFFRAAEGREVLPGGLRAEGAIVDTVVAYVTVQLAEAPPGAVDRLAAHPPDAIAFTSPSTARACVVLLGARARAVLSNAAIASIGPVTTAAIEELGYRVAITAPQSTVPALADAIAQYFAK